MKVIVLQNQGNIYSTYVAENMDVVKAILMTDSTLDEEQGITYYNAYLNESLSESDINKYRKIYSDGFYADCAEISVNDVEENKMLTMEDMFDKLL